MMVKTFLPLSAASTSGGDRPPSAYFTQMVVLVWFSYSTSASASAVWS